MLKRLHCLLSGHWLELHQGYPSDGDEYWIECRRCGQQYEVEIPMNLRPGGVSVWSQKR